MELKHVVNKLSTSIHKAVLSRCCETQINVTFSSDKIQNPTPVQSLSWRLTHIFTTSITATCKCFGELKVAKNTSGFVLVEEFVYVFASSKKTYPYANYPRQAELAWFEFPVGNISRAFGPVIVRFWNVSWQKGRGIQMTRFYFIVKFEWGDSRTAVKNFSTLQGLVVCLRLVINCTWIFFLSPREPGILQPEFWRMAQSYIRTARFISCFPKHKQIFTIPCCKAHKKPHWNTKHSLEPVCFACCRDMKTDVHMKPTQVFISPYHGFEKRPKSV